MALTHKKKMFCEFYIKTFNAKKSAILAGYADSVAEKTSYKLKTDKDCVEYIKTLKQEQNIATTEDVLKYLTNVLESEENTKIKLRAAELLLKGTETETKVEEIVIEVGIEDED